MRTEQLASPDLALASAEEGSGTFSLERLAMSKWTKAEKRFD